MKIKFLILIVLCLVTKSSAESSKNLTLDLLYESLKSNPSNDCKISLNVNQSIYVFGSDCQKFPDRLNKNWLLKNLKIKNTNIVTIKKSTFKNLKFLKKLKFFRNPLKTLEGGSFLGLRNLQDLIIYISSLNTLDSKSFIGLENLKNLIIHRCFIKSIEYVFKAASPSALPKLLSLDVSYNNWRRIEEDYLKHMSGSSVEKLSIVTSSVSHFPGSYYKYFINLKYLNLFGNRHLSHNSIKDIITSLDKSNLETLDLSKLSFPLIPTKLISLIPKNCSLKTLYLRKYGQIISNDTLPFLPTLRNLNLDKSKITAIERDSFVVVNNLTTLSLVDHRMQTIPHAIYALKSLENLYMFQRKSPLILSLKTYDFSQNPKLKLLNLKMNKIHSIDKNTFLGATKLQELILVQCDISAITAGAFEGMNNLKVLDLSSNHLTNIQYKNNHLLPNLVNIERLMVGKSLFSKNLHNNEISPFQHMNRLRELDLSKIRLGKISPKMFMGLVNMTVLRIGGNLIKDWQDYVFSSLKSLKTLDLSKNLIDGKTYSFTKDLELVSDETIVDISWNPFSCECQTRTFLEWIKKTSVNILGLRNYETNLRHTCTETGKSLLDQKPITCLPEPFSNGVITVIAISAIISILFLVFFFVIRYRPKSYLSNAWFHLTIKYNGNNKNNTKYTYDAFISYCSSDFQWINQYLLPSMEDEIDSMKLCIYERDFLPGKEISSCIMESIIKSRKIILVLTNSFIKSQWCIWEVQMAQYLLLEDKRDDIIIILLEDLENSNIPIMLKYLLSTRIYLAWSHDPRQQVIFWTRLQTIIRDSKNSLN